MIKNLFKNKDVKILVENFISLSTLQLVGIILPLVTLPYVIRKLGFEYYGAIMFANSFIAYFQSVTDYSFRITATRDVAVFKDNQQKLNFIYSKVLIIKGIFLIFSLFIILLTVILYSPFYKERLIYFLTSGLLLGYALFPEWFFQGIEKMKYITVLNVGIKLFFTACIFVFIKEKSDYWLYPLFNTAGYIGAGIVGQYILVKKYKLKFVFIKPRIIINTIKTNFPVFINQFAPTLYNNTSTFLLGIFASANMVGIYSAVKKVVDLAATILSIISRVFFPFLNRKKNAFDHYKKIMLFLSATFIVSIIAFNHLIFWYLNLYYENSLLILITLAIGLIGYTFYDIWGLNYFIIMRKDQLVMKNTILASLSGFILAFPLTFYCGVLGAAFNLSLSRSIMGCGLLYDYYKLKNKQNEDCRISCKQ